MRPALSTFIVVAVIVAFTAAGWAGFRTTTTRIPVADAPVPYDGHPASGCVFCHMVED